ncbi:HD-GYP domain-containing protein [Carboxydothermus ferrireducens]|nr:HD-GYP domain-containing protein [Carboxydothermus ferrireducens]
MEKEILYQLAVPVFSELLKDENFEKQVLLGFEQKLKATVGEFSLNLEETLKKLVIFLKGIKEQNNLKALQEIISIHIQRNANIFIFLNELDLFSEAIIEFVFSNYSREKVNKILPAVFYLKRLIEELIYEPAEKEPKEIINAELLTNSQEVIQESLKEIYRWLEPQFVALVVPNSLGVFKVIAGVGEKIEEFARLPLRKTPYSFAGRLPIPTCYREEKIRILPFKDPGILGPFVEIWNKCGIESAVLYPVIFSSYKIGVLVITFPTSLKFPEDFYYRAAKFAENLAKKIIAAYKKNQETEFYCLLKSAQEKSLKVVVSLLEKKDHYTAYHSQLVTRYAVYLGEKLGIDSEGIDYLRTGGIFHDIGKVGIRDMILLKPGSLTGEEWLVMRLHPEYGYQVVKEMDVAMEVREIVRYHHERYDGKGYPHGLKGEEIPFLARICSVADSLEAITSDRIYRKGRDFSFALEEIRRNSKTQFDPEVVAVLKSGVEKELAEIKEQTLREIGET